MARTDGDINIKTKIDTSGVEKDLKSLGSQLKSVSAGLSKSSGIGAGFAAAATTAKQAAKAIKETSDALNVQIKAEKQLETAAKNNPYLTDSSVSQLKDYASQLQKISTVGDEQLIPFMAQLASSGRTQEEIQNIMSAALDVSASGLMSLDSAVQQLNATYSGNIGQMGRQIAELKTLSSEELASGKAIDIVAAKFKGMAEETAAATGSFQQMKNAQGDFNEAVGTITKPTADLWNNFWKGWYEKGTETINNLVTWLDSQTVGKNIANQFKKQLSKFESGDLGGKIDYVKSALPSLSDSELTDLQNYYNSKKTLSADEALVNKRINAEIQGREELTRQLKKQKQEQDELDKKKKEEIDAENTRENYIKDYEKSLDNSLSKLKLEAELKGEDVSQQDELNAYLSAYYDLVQNIGAEDPFAQEKLQELKNYAAGIKNIDTSYDDLLEKIKDFLGEDDDGGKLSDSIQATIDTLQLENDALEENSDAWNENVKKIKELEELKTKVVKKETEAQNAETLEQAKKIVSEISNYLGKYNDIVNSITEAASTSSDKQTTAALQSLSKQYTDGLITYEEYCDEKTELSKKAAREEYKIQLWQWTASLLSATANVAQAVTEALTKGTVYAAITGIAGAAQIASILANRPQAPTFNNGGIVGGSSYSGDRITARVNSGEMVLNRAQQAQLFAMANGNGGGGTNLNISVVNNRGNDTQVSAQMTANGLQVTVDRLVNASMYSGNYNKSMQYANNNANGMRIL